MSLLLESFADTRSDDAYRWIVDALDYLRISVAIYNSADQLTCYNRHFQYIFRSFDILNNLTGIAFRDLLLRK